MLPSNPSNPPKPAKPALGAASCGTPSLSFSTGPKLPDAPFKPFKPSETCETGSWSCQLCHAKIRQVFPFLLARNCLKPFKPSKLALGAASCGRPSLSFFYCLATAGCSLQTLETFRHLPPLVWTSSCPVLGALGAAKLPHLSFLLARQCRMLP